jgi:hypothetical protein
VIEHPHWSEPGNSLHQQPLSLQERERSKVEVLEGKEVERKECRWKLHPRPANIHRRSEAAALLEA